MNYTKKQKKNCFNSLPANHNFRRKMQKLARSSASIVIMNYTDQRKYCKILHNIAKYSKILQNVAKYRKIFQNISKYCKSQFQKNATSGQIIGQLWDHELY